jgi:hypothetical protein
MKFFIHYTQSQNEGLQPGPPEYESIDHAIRPLRVEKASLDIHNNKTAHFK